MPGIFNPRLLFLGFLLVLATIIVACGEEATTTAEPAPAAPEATAAAVPAATAAATTVAAPSAATPAATPAPAVAAPTEAVMEGPSGHLRVGMAEVAPISHVLHLQTYSALKYDTLLTHETMFRRDKTGDLHGMLVKDWTVDPTGLIHTFTFEEGVPWHSSRFR